LDKNDGIAFPVLFVENAGFEVPDMKYFDH
jgi:hypothetical protein